MTDLAAVARTSSKREHTAGISSACRPCRRRGRCSVGFHGYAETAGDHLDALADDSRQPRRGCSSSVQALHPFYTRKERVVASWMTRDDRELAIGDNIDYVGRVLDRVRADHPTRPTLVFSGFSQGGAMAYRAAANYRADGLIMLAARRAAGHRRTPRRARCRRCCSAAERRTSGIPKRRKPLTARRSRSIGARVETCVFDGGHEWTDAFRAAASAFLRRAQQ